MQTPAPCGYERATSVDGAIASLVEFGPTARINLRVVAHSQDSAFAAVLTTACPQRVAGYAA